MEPNFEKFNLNKILEFISDHADEATKIFKAELSMPNIKMKTMGGKTFWDTLATYNGYKLQQNQITRHARILDKDNYRIAWGTVNGMQMVLRRIDDMANEFSHTKRVVDIKEDLEAIKQLYDEGILTTEEYNEQKAKLLSHTR